MCLINLWKALYINGQCMECFIHKCLMYGLCFIHKWSMYINGQCMECFMHKCLMYGMFCTEMVNVHKWSMYGMFYT